MKWMRLLSRIVLISVAAALFMLLTAFYVSSMRPDLAHPFRQAARHNHRPSGPALSRIPEFIGEGILIALLTIAGRAVFRLHLSNPSRGEEQMISLELSRTRARH